jgi:hypothetical protein
MAPRYKLGLGLEGDSPEEDTSLSSIVGNAIMPSLDTSSSIVPTEDYTPTMPNIDFNSLNPAEPVVPVENPKVDYLSSILDEAKQIKDLREQASVAAKQELDPEQSIATVLMSAIPALLGLAVSGKRGLASAGLVSGPAAMKYAEERRNDRKNEAAALNQQATALQQALNLDIKETNRDRRDELRYAVQAERDRLNRLADIAAIEKRAGITETNKQKREDEKANGLLGVDKIPVKSNLPLDKVSSLAEKDYEKDAVYGTLLSEIRSMKADWPSLSDAEKTTRASNLLLLTKEANNAGAAFSGMEKGLNQAGIPVTVTSKSDLQDIREGITQSLSKIPPDKLFDNLLNYYGNRYYNALTVTRPDLTSETYSYLAPYIRNPIASQKDANAPKQTGVFSNSFRSTLQDIAAGKK